MRITSYMKCLRHPFLASSLVACLLLVGGVFASQSAAHSLHHDHHNASTHASVICSWMCAAGQVVEVADPILDSPLFSISKLEVVPVDLIRTVSLLLTFDRGPPHAFL